MTPEAPIIGPEIFSISDPKEIFPDIREHDAQIKDKYSQKLIPIKDYVLLYSSTGEDFNFLGLNKIDLFNKPNDERKSFWLLNRELFAILCSIYYAWFMDKEANNEIANVNESFKPIDWINKLNVKVITIEPERNWFAFIVNLTKIKNTIPKSSLRDSLDTLDELGYSLFLTAENSFRNFASTNIFLQICSNKYVYKQDFIIGNDINFSSLTLEKTSIKSTYFNDPSRLYSFFKEGYSIQSICNEFHKQSIEFKTAVEGFINLHKLMQEVQMNYESYNAILLDLYDRNRSTSSVMHDKRLQNLIKKTIKNGTVGVENKNYNWASIIDSIIINNSIELKSKIQSSIYELSHIFSKKMVITKMQRIHSSIFQSSNAKLELNKYVADQVVLHRNIKNILSKNRQQTIDF